MVFALSPRGPLAFAPANACATTAGCSTRARTAAARSRSRPTAARSRPGTAKGRNSEPALWLAARSEAGFAAPLALHEGAGSLPDRVALAIGADGAGLVLWERRSPVRSEIAARALGARGRLGDVRVVSSGVHASGPALAAAPGGNSSRPGTKRRFRRCARWWWSSR